VAKKRRGSEKDATVVSGKEGRPHTPIVSKKQRSLFGAELARRRAGRKSRMKSITTKELESHLRESKGKRLPARSKSGKREKGQGTKRR
jgi:hypothetical protein